MNDDETRDTDGEDGGALSESWLAEQARLIDLEEGFA